MRLGWRLRTFLLGLFLQLAGKLLHSLAHHLPGLELNGCARGNHKAAAWLVRISTNARLSQPRLKHPKIAQFNRDVPGQTVGDLIESPLNYVKHLMLNFAGLITDRDYDVAFS